MKLVITIVIGLVVLLVILFKNCRESLKIAKPNKISKAVIESLNRPGKISRLNNNLQQIIYNHYFYASYIATSSNSYTAFIISTNSFIVFFNSFISLLIPIISLENETIFCS